MAATSSGGRAGRLQLLDRGPEAGGLVGHDLDRPGPGEGDGLGVGGPVGRREEHLVAGVEEGLEGGVDGVLAAVGDDDLPAAHLEARVPGGLGGDRLAQRREAGGRGVPVHRRVAAGRDRGLDDVGRGREVRLPGTEADDGFAGRLQGLGLRVDGQRGGLGDGGYPFGDASHWLR
jgi:hypothetical protein